MDYTNLIAKAVQAKKHAYVPYSNLHVGYGATNCAERTAIFKAVSEGKRNFVAMAVVSDMERLIYPCGICRQVLAEFRVPLVVVGNQSGDYKVYSTDALLPNAFTDFES